MVTYIVVFGHTFELHTKKNWRFWELFLCSFYCRIFTFYKAVALDWSTHFLYNTGDEPLYWFKSKTLKSKGHCKPLWNPWSNPNLTVYKQKKHLCDALIKKIYYLPSVITCTYLFSYCYNHKELIQNIPQKIHLLTYFFLFLLENDHR